MRNLLIGVLAAALAGAPLTSAYAQGGLDTFEAAKFKGPGNGKGGGPPPKSEEPTTLCAMSDIGQTEGSCYGWVWGNYNGGSGDQNAFSASVLNTLLDVDTFTGPTLTWKENLGSISGNTVDFATTLYGLTVVAFHVGGAGGEENGVGYQSTAWYVFDAGTTGVDVLSFNRAGLSNARLYSTGAPPCLTCNAVPEPSAWALMILGFGAVGAIVRRRRWALA